MRPFRIIVSTLLLFAPAFVCAQEYSSTDYTVTTPVIFPGGFSSSASFGLQSFVSQVAPAAGSSASFTNNPGFLFYPYVTTPALSATPGDSQVALSWTSATGYLGFNVTSYEYGKATVSGGPYGFVSAGTLLNTTVTGLTNATTYYFIVRAKDAFGNVIATSTEVSATPARSGGGGSSGGGGGGGGGGGAGGGGVGGSGSSVFLSGRAYPGSTVTVLKDGQIALTTIADPLSNFSTSINDLSAGTYSFVVYATDSKGNRSAPFPFPVTLTTNTNTNIGGIFLSPTIGVDKSEVKKGDTVAIFGVSAASSTVTIAIHSSQEIFARTTSDKSGAYLYNLDTSVLDPGGHNAQSKSTVGNEISPYSISAGFSVGAQNVAAQSTSCPSKGDLNGDCHVNLVDFSIAAYWYKRPLSAAFLALEKQHLSGDGTIDLVDFSIMAYYWTG